MKKIVHYSLNLIIVLAMLTMFTESSLAFNRNIKMSDATQADAIVVSKTNITFGVAASIDTFSITSAVSWVITSNQTWLTVTPTSGSNNGVVYVAATANTGTAARSGTITIVAASTLTGTNVAKTVLVTQAAQTPTTTLNVSRTSISLSSYNACADTFAITSNASWTLTLSSTTSGTGIAPTWLTVTPTAGTNNAIINVAAVANTTTTARYAVVIVTSGNISKSVVITQAAAPVSTLNVSRTTIALPTYNACADTFAITSNVNWTIAINGGTNSATIPTWLTATPTSGSNNAVVNIAAVANTTTAARTAYLVVSSGTLSKTITVTQAAAPIPVSYLNVSRTSIALPTYNACADTFAVTSNVTWTVTISGSTTPGGITSIPTWLTVTPTSGANNAVINVAAVANTTTSARTAYVVVTSGNLSKTVLVTQPAAPVSYLNVSRTSITLPTYNACADTFAITANVAWTIAINGGSNTTTIPTWLTVTPTTGINDMVINIAATANTTSAARTAYIVVTSGTISKTITVTQAATPTYLYVSRTTIALPTYNACADTFAITSNVTWTITISGSTTPGGITSIPTWLTVTPTTGTNNAVINIAAVANTTTSARYAYIVVTSGNLSKTVLVTQPAAPASYLNVSRTSIALTTYNACADTFAITSNVAWTIAINGGSNITTIPTWLTVTPTTGTNDMLINIAATANTTTAARTAYIVVTSGTISKTVTVTQAATPTYLYVSRTTIALPTYNACADTFAITSNVTWTITISGTTASGTSNTIPTWLTVTPTTGTNNAVINVSAVANTTTSARTAYVVVTSGNLSKTVLVTQPAAPVSYLNVSRTIIALPTYNACADTFAVTSNVAWTIAINGGSNTTTIPTWLTVTPTSGSNDMVINIAATANTTSAARTAYIVVTSGTISKTVTVTQAATPTYLYVSRTTIALPTYNACADTFAITSNVTWTVTISGSTASGTSNTIPTWLTVTPTTGTNNAVINIAAVANSTTSARYAYIVVTSGNLSKTVLVTQLAAPASYLNVSRTIISLPTYNACADTFAITSNVAWTIAINGGTNSATIPTWLTVTPTSGSNNAVVNIAALANTTTAARTAYIVVTSGTISKTITVTQAATPIYLYVSRTTIALPTYNACADTFAITSNVTWTITISGTTASGTSNTIPTWLTVTPTLGSNNAVINIAAVANTTTAARYAYIVVTSGNFSKTILVTQPAAPASYLYVSRTSITLPTYNACADTFAIASNVNWSITISTSISTNPGTPLPAWLTVTPITGLNNMVVNIAATANTTNAARYAYVVITSGTLSKTILVIQPAAILPVSYLNVSRTNITLATNNACTDTFAITSNLLWTISVASNSAGSSTAASWLAVSPSSGSNNMIIQIAATANTSTAARTAYITVSSGTITKTIIVKQIGATVNPGLTTLANNINYNTNPNNDKNIDYNVIIYPNPTKDFIVITPQQQFTSNDFVEIYSLDGRKVMTQILNGSNAKIDMQGLKNGIYFARITQNSQVVVKTISKN